MHALAGLKIGGILPVSAILNASIRLGSRGVSALPRTGGHDCFEKISAAGTPGS
jgi:hypothetical protein